MRKLRQGLLFLVSTLLAHGRRPGTRFLCPSGTQLLPRLDVAPSMLSTPHLIGFPQGQLFIGILVSLAAIAVHALIMAALSWSAHWAAVVTQAAGARLQLVLVMMATVSILMAAHLIEIVIWAMTYTLVGAVP